MLAEEELSLPPWEKFIKYRLFPYKLCLHIGLVCLITSLIVIINLAFSGYSRSIWQSSVNILYPEDFTDFQTDNTSPYEYFIYTQDRAIDDANRLINQYFQLPEVAVNDIDVYNVTNAQLSNGDLDSDDGIRVGEIVVELTSGESNYQIYSEDDSSGFPLSYDNLNNTDIRSFFNVLRRMTFKFYVRSHGTTDSTATNEKELCFNWLWSIVYDNAASGRIRVSSKPSIQSRCDDLPATSIIYGLSLTIVIFAFWYQILLCKAVWRQLIILNEIQTSTLLLIDEKETTVKSLDKTNAIQRQLLESQHQRRIRDSRVNSLGKLGRKNTSNSRSVTDGHLDILNAALNINQLHGERPPERSKRRGNYDEDYENSSEDNQALLSEHGYESSHSRRSSRSSTSHASRQMTLATMDEDLKLLRDALDSLTWRDIFMIVNLWFVVSTLGNAFALLFACRIVINHTDVMAETFLKGGLGLACLMHWFGLVQYLEYFPRYYIMISMLKITVPRVSQFLFGVLPLFIGYALLGMICFGDVSEKFGDLSETLRTLFSVVNGDIIYDTFYSVDFAGLGGQIYLYLYTLIFTYVVLMTIIAIVEEAFFEAQETKPITNSNSKSKDPSSALRDSDISEPEHDSNPLYSENRPSDMSSHNTSSKNTLIPDECQSYASSNTSSMRGKRDLPDHLKYLLKNVDRTNTQPVASDVG